MMLHVRAPDPPAHPGCVLADVGVFDPVDEAGGEICGEDDNDGLQGEGEEGMHEAEPLVRRWTEQGIDSL